MIIGYKEDKEIKLEEIDTGDNDILALEGVIRGEKTRIILSYFDSSKNKTNEDYKRNREIQGKVESLMEVEPEVALISLGDMNGRLTRLEPNISTDANGKMLEDWTTKLDMHHLNLTDQCTGKYTFKSKNGRSAIDHILVNDWLFEKYIGMHIDEDRMQLDISDHCVVRAWFKLKSRGDRTSWKKNNTKEIQWIKKDEETLDKFEEAFLPKVGKCTTFKNCMKKIKDILHLTMRKRKRVKIGKRG